jgi:uncharacterized membrane protein YozB (DUF420 family)
MGYLEPVGFLGTGASLLADLTLMAYILLIVPGMLAGWFFARRNMHRPQHKWVMTGITVINWVLIVWLMLVAYNFDVVGNLPTQPINPRYIVPAIHGVLGLVAQVLATYVIYRMLKEDAQVAAAKKRGERDLMKYWFTSAKPVMRVTLALWLITALLGVGNYLVRYDVIPVGAGDVAPVATEEPLATDEPVMTEEPMMTEEAVMTDEAMAPTEEAVTPTEEVMITEEAMAPTEEAMVEPAATEAG